VAIDQFLAHWGLAAVFVGAMAEGESFVIGGGALASQDLLVAWQVALAAFTGSVAMDQACFWAGRRCRGHRLIEAIRRKPACGRALAFVDRHPTGYILGFRYLYGLRIISPLAIGLTNVSATRFLALNAASAAVWAILFTAIGFAAGQAYKSLFGEVHSILLLLLGLVILAGLGAAAAHRVTRKV
jgi:membrane protein DedA with SNARE-associated domain